MKHIIIRIIIGIIWIIVAGYCFFTENYIMTVIGVIAGIAYLYSAYSMNKRNKGSKE